MEGIVDFPIGWEFQSICGMRDYGRDGEWSMAFRSEFRRWMSGVKVPGVQPNTVTWTIG